MTRRCRARSIRTPASLSLIHRGRFVLLQHHADQLFIWNGSEWRTPYALAPGFQNNFVYVATAGQTVFFGPDVNGRTPVVGSSPSDVYKDGVRLVEGSEFTVDAVNSKLTLLTPANAGAIVQWDLLVPTDQIAPGSISIYKAAITPTPNGVVTSFEMSYANPTTGTQPVTASSSAQIMVSIDGVIQEPGVDFTANEATLVFSAAPPADAKLWVLWFGNTAKEEVIAARVRQANANGTMINT